MNNENVASAWDCLYQYICSEISKDSFSQYSQSSISSSYVPSSQQQHDSSKNLITLFPDMITEMILQSGSEQDVEEIFLKLLEDPGPCSNKLAMILNLATSVEKLCPDVKPVVQELRMGLNSMTSEAHGSMNNDRKLLKCIQKFCFYAARALPLPLSSEASANHDDDENMSIQDVVLRRLKEEVLPEEIPEILKTIKNDDTPMRIMDAPISEDFNVASPVEHTLHRDTKNKCSVCGLVFRSNVAMFHHIQKFHKRMKENTICNQQFDSQRGLLKHSVCHGLGTNKPNFKCKFCEKKFVLKSQKEKHENSHIADGNMDISLNCSDSSTALTQFKESLKQKKYSGRSSYLLSSNCSWCYNCSTKEVQRVDDITSHCTIILNTIK